MPSDWAVVTGGLGRVFKTRGEPEKVALREINLQIPTGEVFGLLGPNGAGKTTLIKILATLLLPSTGTVRVLDLDVLTQAQALRWQINMVSGGENSGYGILTVEENLHLFGQLYGLSYAESRRRIAELLEIVGLKEAARVRYNRLSTGMKQKLQFARGFMSDPRLLFLDEPTLGLDVAISRQIRAYVKQWVREKPGRTLLLTTHYMAEADELCDRVAIIDQGRIVALDSPGNLKRQVASAGAEPTLEDVFLSLCGRRLTEGGEPQ